MNDGEDVVGIVAGLEEAADQLLEQEKHVEAAQATAHLLSEDPSLKKDGVGIVGGDAAAAAAGVIGIGDGAAGGGGGEFTALIARDDNSELKPPPKPK